MARSASTPARRGLARVLVGIRLPALGGQDGDLARDARGKAPAAALRRRREAGDVAVEQDRHLAAIAALEQLDVLGRERGAADGHGVRDARLVQADDVEVALDEHGGARLADGLAREIEKP